jgi:hypothetical protein
VPQPPAGSGSVAIRDNPARLGYNEVTHVIDA